MVDYKKAKFDPSPHCWKGRAGHKVRAIVLHGTAGPNAVGWFKDPASEVSAHYVVEMDGTVTQCVAEADSAWHAGEVSSDSKFFHGPNPNRWTIGIEHTRNKANNSPITEAQLAASLDLVKDIVQRHGPLQLILHDEVQIGRICPGPHFPLQAFVDALDDDERLDALLSQIGFLTDDVAAALEAGLDGAEATDPEPPQERQDAYQAIRAATNTLRGHHGPHAGATVGDLETVVAVLTGDVATALQAGLQGAQAADAEPPVERQEAYDAIQAAINTLRRGG